MNRTLTTAALAASLLLGGCANWQHNAYEGLRAGGTMASLRAPPAAIPAPTMPSYERYQEQRERLQRSPE